MGFIPREQLTPYDHFKRLAESELCQGCYKSPCICLHDDAPCDPVDDDGVCPRCEYQEGRSEADKRYHEENCRAIERAQFNGMMAI